VRLQKHLLLLSLLLLINFAAAAQTVPSQKAEASPESPDPAELPDGTFAGKEKPFLVWNEGVSTTWVTRIIRQEDRSNFVFSDFMFGMYLGVQSVNMQPLNSVIRLTAYYPVTAKFNTFPQIPKSPLHYALDLFAGVDFELNMWQMVRFNLAPGLHVFFQNADRWNYVNVGIGGLAGLELPLTRGWTFMVNGIASLDDGNLGTNSTMEPYNFVYQYQLDLGVRYSKKNSNPKPYIKPRNQL
jgi:hypothetical protein